MKKVVLILFLLIFILPVKANEEVLDKLTIEELNTNIVIFYEGKYRVTENYKTRLVFGTFPSTTYFVKKIPLTHDYKYYNKEYKFKMEPELLEVIGKDEYSLKKSEDNLEIFIGKQYVLLNEVENIEISYDVKLEREEDSFIYDISNNGYDVEKINFEIMFPEEIEGKRVRFGLNSKDFKDTLDGLTYEIKHGILLSGTYNKKLNANDRLRIMIGEPNIKEFNYILIYIPIGTVVILLLYVIVKMANRKI